MKQTQGYYPYRLSNSTLPIPSVEPRELGTLGRLVSLLLLLLAVIDGWNVFANLIVAVVACAATTLGIDLAELQCKQDPSGERPAFV